MYATTSDTDIFARPLYVSGLLFKGNIQPRISESVTGGISIFGFDFRVDRSSSPIDLTGRFSMIFDDFLRNGGV